MRSGPVGGAVIEAVIARARPWWVAAAVFLGAAARCGPWGDYPLNDDWLYARSAKHFAETGTIALDATAVATSVVGQTVAAAPVIALFGFSHTALRLLTLLLGAIGLWCV